MVAKIEVRDGTKGNNDKIILINGIQITYIELAELLIMLCKNEDEVYDKDWHKGRFMLIEFLLKAMLNMEVTEEMKSEYRL